MNARPPNPYFNKAITREPDMFFGRADLLRYLYESLAYHQSVSVIGPRGIGKSSLLWHACLTEIQQGFPFDFDRVLFVFLDLREYLTKTSEDFFHSISKAIIAQGARKHLTLHTESVGEDEFSDILDQVAEKKHFPVLLLDSFDKVTRNKHFDPEFFEFLRAHASMGLVSFVTATLLPLSRVCHREIAGSPFFNIFYTYHLEALAPEEAWALITTPAELTGLSFTEEEAGHILKLAGRHPFFIQRVCYILFEHKRWPGNEPLDMQSLKGLAYKELLPVFSDIWTELTEDQQTHLLDEAQQKINPQRTLPELSESQLFRHFVRKTCQRGLFYMTVENLKDVLDIINSGPKILGDTDLRLMKIVAQRLQTELSPTVTDRGLVIREILNEAFARLQGTGNRSDQAPDWKLYNLLYYRYFKYKLKNGQIAGRLGLTSMRMYYRTQEKAIEALLNALLDIEYTLTTEEER